MAEVTVSSYLRVQGRFYTVSFTNRTAGLDTAKETMAAVIYQFADELVAIDGTPEFLRQEAAALQIDADAAQATADGVQAGVPAVYTQQEADDAQAAADAAQAAADAKLQEAIDEENNLWP